MRDTIVEVDMPSERVEVETTDSVSVLTTDRAISRAEVEVNYSLYVPECTGVPTTTVTKTRTDSVPYPVEKEKVVEVVPSWSWWRWRPVCTGIYGNMNNVTHPSI